MSVVVLVRHGRTAWNRTRFLGRRDLLLDATGVAQAARAAVDGVALLAGVPGPVTVWSSPLQRARATAAPLAAALGVDVRVHDDLVELDCGAWEGREKAEVGRKVSTLPPDERVPGGESAADVWARLHRFLDETGLARDGHDPAVVVGHHLLNKLLRAALVGDPVDGALASAAYRPAPGSVVLLDRATGTLTAAPGAGPRSGSGDPAGAGPAAVAR